MLLKIYLEFTFRSFFHGFAKISISGTFVKLDSKVNNRNIDGGNSERHTSEFSFQLRKNKTNSLSSTSGRRNNIRWSSSTSSPVLTTLRGSINNQLSSGRGMDCSHETFNNTEFFVENLSNRSKTISSARSIRNNILRSLIVFVVNTKDIGRCIILSRSRKNDFFGTTLNVSTSLFLGKESTSRFTNEISTDFTPLQ